MTEQIHKKVKTNNGYQLSATFYIPDGEVKAAVLIVPAMGVSQKYYSSFASWTAAVLDRAQSRWPNFWVGSRT